MKILIVGAGPTGLAAALEFTRQGITPEIVDAKEEPSVYSRAVGILPRSLEILGRSGVAERIADEGVSADAIHIYRGNSTLFSFNFSDVTEVKRNIIGLPQNRTETILSDALEKQGVSVSYNKAVTDLTNKEQSVLATFKNGEKKEYDWVIGADGINSTVRTSLGINFVGYDLDEQWSIADVEIESEYDQHEFRAWLLNNDRKEKDIMVMVPIAPGRVRLVSSTPDCIEALPINLALKKIRRSGTFTISVKQAEHYVVKRVLLAGDAAHVHSPVGGRGMNLGIEDAACAVDAILNNKLSGYESQRKKKATSIIKITEGTRKTLVSKNLLVQALLTIFAFLVQHTSVFKKLLVKRITTL